MNYHDYIDDYLDDALPAVQRIAFEAAMAQDTALQAAVQEQLQLRKLLQAAALRARVSHLQQSATATATPIRAMRRNHAFALWAIAASLLLAVGIGIYWWSHRPTLSAAPPEMATVTPDENTMRSAPPATPNPTPTYEAPKTDEAAPKTVPEKRAPIAAHHSKKSPSSAQLPATPLEPPLIRGNARETLAALPEATTQLYLQYFAFLPLTTADSAAQRSWASIKSQRLATADSLMRLIADTDAQTLLKGILLGQQQQYEAAIRMLYPLQKKENSYQEQAQWYMAWYFLLQDKSQAARPLFKRIADNAQHPKQNEALRVVEALQ